MIVCILSISYVVSNSVFGAGVMRLLFIVSCRMHTDDADLADDQSGGRSWEQQKQRIKAVEDKYRWKLNERRVCTCFAFYAR